MKVRVAILAKRDLMSLLVNYSSNYLQQTDVQVYEVFNEIIS